MFKKLLYVFLICCGSGIRTTRPPGYEPDELPLLYPAIYVIYAVYIYIPIWLQPR